MAECGSYEADKLTKEGTKHKKRRLESKVDTTPSTAALDRIAYAYLPLDTKEDTAVAKRTSTTVDCRVHLQFLRLVA